MQSVSTTKEKACFIKGIENTDIKNGDIYKSNMIAQYAGISVEKNRDRDSAKKISKKHGSEDCIIIWKIVSYEYRI